MIRSTNNMVPLKQIKPPSLVTLLLLGNSFLSFTDGCLRRSSSKSTNQERPDMVDGSTVSPSHKLPCMLDEAERTNCLNGGDCFAVPSYNGMRETGCTCRSSWEGRRCELAFIDPEILAIHQRNIRTAHIAAGVSVCILVFFFILVCVYVYIKYKRKSHLLRESSKEGLEALRGYNQPTHILTSESPVHIKMKLDPTCHQNNNEESQCQDPLIESNKKGPDKIREANGRSNPRASRKDGDSNV